MGLAYLYSVGGGLSRGDWNGRVTSQTRNSIAIYRVCGWGVGYGGGGAAVSGSVGVERKRDE